MKPLDLDFAKFINLVAKDGVTLISKPNLHATLSARVAELTLSANQELVHIEPKQVRLSHNLELKIKKKSIFSKF